MKHFLRLFLTILSLTFFVGCDSSTPKASPSVVEPFKDGDKVELKSVSGAKITLLRKNGGFVIEDDEEKILMFDIFGTFCAPCQEEAPSLMDFQLQNGDNVMLIGLNFFEEVSDEYVVENFAAKYNAYYFISNAAANKRLVETILRDIQYKATLQVPFKVVLKKGVYQNVRDIYTNLPDTKFYIGKVGLDVIQRDIDRIVEK
ncbi:TlpA family protein disulfide reductase [Sulfurospirillum cavolei]|jgi:thiol-disulfide isomerase/thioredoxin|uniref:TlpA family protein disulfide reductase n=1 Tax=Sulfurospirillum cavolei TaxID=366522 RepID=UPI003FA1D216